MSETFKTRLVTERDELVQKLIKLSAFLAQDEPPNMDATQYNLLLIQESVMKSYLGILNARLDLLDI